MVRSMLLCVWLLMLVRANAADVTSNHRFPSTAPEKEAKKSVGSLRAGPKNQRALAADCNDPNEHFCGADEDENGDPVLLFDVCTVGGDSLCVPEQEAHQGLVGTGKGRSCDVATCGCCAPEDEPFCRDAPGDIPRLFPSCDFADFSCTDEDGEEGALFCCVKSGKSSVQQVCGDPLTVPKFEKGDMFIGCGMDCQASSGPTMEPSPAPSLTPTSDASSSPSSAPSPEPSSIPSSSNAPSVVPSYTPSMVPTDSCLACDGDPACRYVGVSMTQEAHRQFALMNRCSLASIVGEEEQIAASAVLDQFVSSLNSVWTDAAALTRIPGSLGFDYINNGVSGSLPALYKCCGPTQNENDFAGCSVPEPPRCVIRTPVSGILAVDNGGIQQASIRNTTDQGGLTPPNTNGVTQFDSYLGSHTWRYVAPVGGQLAPNYEWWYFGVTTTTVLYDMGGTYQLDAVAWWNGDAFSMDVDLFASTDGVSFTPVARFTPAVNPNMQDFSMKTSPFRNPFRPGTSE